MTCLPNNNRCKLLVLDIDINQLNSDDLRRFFIPYGPIESVEIFPRCSAAIIYFVSYLSVDRLVSYRTYLIHQNYVRLRRFRLDQTNWNIDCRTLRVKFNTTTNNKLTELSLAHCFKEYQSYIEKITVYPNNHGLILFSDYNYVDQLLLLPVNVYQINNKTLTLERMIQKKRDPIVGRLLNQNEYLLKQLRDKQNNSRDDIEQLEAEIFILKNENAQLNQNIKTRRRVLVDISNRCSNDQYHRKRSRSNSSEKPIKRR
ncbi:unnamed protein product [Adineta steineri]|uniref:RRM domain-containing protein n=1 Tax=Adineta steineri TaxID=433720 RepID=A0A814YLF6_9BILA|nr:unnamed protein product [Adineta steineri]CAF1231226.1 unnamed protein product [Adineta steineri]